MESIPCSSAPVSGLPGTAIAFSVLRMSADKPAVRASIDFFRNYNRLVGAAYVAIVVITIGFFGHQITQKRAEEIETIQGYVERHGQLIEFVLRSSVDHVEAMRISATSSYAASAAGAQGAVSSAGIKLSGLLVPSADKSSFNLDHAPEPDATGNLTGLGGLEQRSPEFYRDIEMALGLDKNFQTISLNLPNAVSSRFIGIERFSMVFPWTESTTTRFSLADYSTPTWRLGTPEHSRTPYKYWAPVYYGGKDNGLLVPLGAPVYDGTSFRGVVSIDTSLDYLNRINGDFGYGLGVAFLVDANHQVLAHPEHYADALAVEKTPTLAAVMPPGILEQRRLEEIPALVPTEIDGHLVIRRPFISAPWNLVYVLPQEQLWSKLIVERGPLMLAVVVGLTLLMLVTYGVTSREFIAPARKLVEHIAAESRFQPAPIPWVPNAWAPWFETISKAFSESLQLVGIRQELDIAAKMQHAILPRTWPRHDDFAAWGTMRSAKEVGGDFYDHFPLEGGRIGIVVADVSGKGVPAALFAMVSKTLIRATAMHGGAPNSTIEAVNAALCEDNDACMFVTTLYAVFDPHDGTLVYVNAGHPPPLLVHADGSSEFVEATGGAALGVIENLSFAQATLALRPGDTLLLYTDGVTESFDAQGVEFSAARLPSLFANERPTGVNDSVERVIRAVDAHAGTAPQFDDITCVALQYRPSMATFAS